MSFVRFLKPPIFEDEEEARVAQSLHNIQLSLLAMVLFVLPVVLIMGETDSALGLVGGIVILLLTMWLNRRGYVQFSGLALVLLVLGALNYLLWIGQGIHDIVMMGYALVLIIAGLLLSRRLYFLILVLTILSADFIIVAEINGWINTSFGSHTDYSDVLIVSAILATVGLIMRMLSDNLFRSLTKTRQIADQQSRLFLETRNQAEQLNTLNQIGIALASGVDLEQVLIQLYQQLKSVVPVDSFYVALVDSEANLITFPFFISLGERVYVPIATLDTGPGLTGEVIRTQRTLNLPDCDDPKTMQEHQILNVGPGDTRTYLGIPLHLHGKLIGVLSVQCIEPYTYSEEQIRLIETITSQASVAIDNAQLFVEIKDALRREERLNELAHIISGVVDLQFILENVVRLSVELLSTDAGMLSLVSSEKDVISDVYDFNIPFPLDGAILPKGQGVTWEIIESGLPLCLSNYPDHPKALPDLVAAGFHGYIGTPILAGEQCLGALGLSCLDPSRRFTERDLALLEAIGRLAGSAIQNARLFAALQEELAERRRVEQALHRHDAVLEAMTFAAEKFLSVPDWELNIPQVLDRIGQVTNVTHAYLIEIDNKGAEPEFSIRFAYSASNAPLMLREDTHTRLPLHMIGIKEWFNTLERGEAFVGIPASSNSHASQPEEIDFYKMLGIRSLLSVPVFIDQTLWGILNFDDSFVARQWSETEVDALKVAAGILSAAVQRQRADKAMRESEERYRLISSVSSDYTFSTNINGEGNMSLNWVAGAFEAMTGYTLDEYKAQGGWLAQLYPADVEKDRQALEKLKKNQSVTHEIRTITKAKKLKWVQVYAHPIWDENTSQLVGIVGAVQDITERKQAEEQIRQTSNQLSMMNEIGRAVTELQDLESVLEIIHQQVAQVIPLNFLFISLYDAEIKILTFSLCYENGKYWQESDTVMTPGTATSQVIQTGISILRLLTPEELKARQESSENLLSENRLGDRSRVSGSLMYVPLLTKGRVIGVLSAQSYDLNAYTEENLRLLEGVALQAAIAIENAQLFTGLQKELSQRKRAEAELQKSASQLELRDAILQAVAFGAETFMKATDWRDSINEFLEMLGKETGTSHAYIYKTHTDQAGGLVFSMDYEWTAPGEITDLDNPFFLAVPLERIGAKNWLVAMLRGEPYYGSINSFPPEEAEVIKFFDLKAALDVPIHVGNSFWGFIGFDDLRNEREWSEAEVDSLKAAAGILSAAIQRQLNDEAIRQLNAELEQRVRLRTTELETANRELESFAYSVSHDLRTPLRGIDGYSQLLLEDFNAVLDDQGRVYLDNVRRATSQMGRLIDDLLKLSRVTRLEMHYELFDLTGKANELLAELRRQEPDRDVQVTIQPDMVAFGDASLLRLAIENLISNAWKFTSKNPQARIEVGEKKQDRQPVFFVRDNGVGFNMKYSHKLFVAFQRLHNAEDFEGTGVGLATVQRIINRHSGRIWAEAAVDQGATFFFTLPAADDARD